MKPFAIFIAAIFVILNVAVAANADNFGNKYDDAYLDCIDYGHRPVTPEKDKACSEYAKERVLANKAFLDAYLLCVGDNKNLSPSEDQECLRKASR